MLDRIKRLGSETIIYGIMTVTGRFLTFLLVPFYTNILEPGEYGIVAYLFSLIAFLTIFFSYGMESSYFKYASTGEIGTGKQNFSTPFFSLLVSSVLFSSLISFFSSDLSSLAGFGASGNRLIMMAAWILCFDTVALVPFAALRLQHRPGLFATVKLINIVINVTLNILFLAVLGYGVEGVFLAGLIASGVTAAILMPLSWKSLAPTFSFELWKQLLKFGIPYVPAGVASVALQVIDRPIMRILTDDATVGIYQANYRLGIVIMLMVTTFDYAYRPFFLNTAREPDAKDLYARVATYFYSIMAFVWIAVTVFIHDIVRVPIGDNYLIHPDYWGGLAIVPVVMLAYIFTGWVTLLMPGIFIEKKTQYLPLITGVAAATNLISNIVLIPVYGIMGAALATLASYIVYAALMYWVSQKFYPITFELKRLLIVSFIFILCGGTGYYFLFLSETETGILMKLIILVSFPILLLISGFMSTDEIRILKTRAGRMRRWRKR
jgi:O-antigen/teichoic acid export membrane protein